MGLILSTLLLGFLFIFFVVMYSTVYCKKPPWELHNFKKTQPCKSWNINPPEQQVQNAKLIQVQILVFFSVPVCLVLHHKQVLG